MASGTSNATDCCITEVFSWGGKKKNKFVLTLSDLTGTSVLRGPLTAGHETLMPHTTQPNYRGNSHWPNCHFFDILTFISHFTACLFYAGYHKCTALSFNPNTTHTHKLHSSPGTIHYWPHFWDDWHAKSPFLSFSSLKPGTKQVARYCRDKRKLIEYVYVPSDCEISSLGRIQHVESENPPASLHGGVN